MKSAALASLWWMLLVARTEAQIYLNSFPDLVQVGQTYNLTWTAEANYTYNIWLIRDESKYDDNEYDWTKVQGLTAGEDFGTLTPTYSWTVPSNISTNDTYALWMNAGQIPFHGGTLSFETEWFKVTTSQIPTSPASSSTAATSTSTSVSTGADRGGNSTSGSGGLSGGAIAGIVIGVLALLGLVAAGFFILRGRKSRSTLEDREAEDRARRLEPVMQEGYPSYEMKRTTSRA